MLCVCCLTCGKYSMLLVALTEVCTLRHNCAYIHCNQTICLQLGHMTRSRNESWVMCLQSSHMMQCSYATWLFACRLTPHDSARYWGRFEPGTYDCVLLDAPCTSERHLLQQAASGSGKSAKLRWSVRQCEDMAALQIRLLTAALKVSKFSWQWS